MSNRIVIFCNQCKNILKGRITMIYIDGYAYVGYCRPCMKGMNMKEYNKSIEALKKAHKKVESVDLRV